MGFFSGIEFLLLLKNISNFKVKCKHGYVEECMILKYVNPEVGRGKSRSLQPQSLFFWLKMCIHYALGKFLHILTFRSFLGKHKKI